MPLLNHTVCTVELPSR